MVLLGKIMILQGVGHPISCLGVCYANDPKKGGYMTPAPALDLTTSLRGDFWLQLTVLLWQNHHPRVLPKAFQWKVVSMCKSSRSSGAGPRKFTLSWSRSRSTYIASPLNASYAEFFCFMLQFLYLQMCVYSGSAAPQGGGGVTW